MAIKALPTVSDVIYLQDLVPQIELLEGECPNEEKAYVIVRQATEADSMAIDQMSSERRVVWSENEVQEIRDSRMREVWAMQVFRCMCDAGNIFGPDGEPLCKFSSGKMHARYVEGTFRDFLKSFGAQSPLVTRALRYAAWEMNPDWDLRQPEGEGPKDQTNS